MLRHKIPVFDVPTPRILYTQHRAEMLERESAI